MATSPGTGVSLARAADRNLNTAARTTWVAAAPAKVHSRDRWSNGRGPPTIEGMIEVDHVTKRYGEKVAVEDLTFTVRPGIVTGFLGPNGAGKSTTMRVMLGLDAPTSGRTRVNG